jgi:hypothetical protein
MDPKILGPIQEAMGPQMTPEEMLLQRMQNLQMQGLEEQRGSIQDTKSRLEELEQNPRSNQANILAALSDAVTGSRFTPLAQAISGQQPSREELEKRLRQEQQALTKGEIDLLGKQLYGVQTLKQADLQEQRLQQQAKDRQDRRKEKQAKPEKRPSGDMFKAAGFGRRLEQAEGVFEKLADQGYDRTEFGQSFRSILPGFTKPDELKSQEQAERNFVNAVLRRESGAAISASEFDSAEEQYFPRPGDTPQVIEQKRQNREQVLNQLRAEAGNAWEQVRPVGKDNNRLQELLNKARGN